MKISYCNKKYSKVGWVFIMPSLIGVSIFVLIPYLDILKRSFITNKVTLENYSIVIQNEAFQLAVKNTLKFIVVSIPLLVLVSLVISYAITLLGDKSKLIKIGCLIPSALPVTTIIILWNVIFHRHGLLNYGLGFSPEEGRDWLNSSATFGVLVFSYTWRNIGFAIVLWITGILSIPKEIIESARVDGAGSVKRFLYIILPNLIYYFLCVVILALVNSFKVFREAYLIAGEYPSESIYMLQHLFNNWFRNLEIGKLSAGAILLLVLSLVLIIFLERVLSRKGLEL